MMGDLIRKTPITGRPILPVTESPTLPVQRKVRGTVATVRCDRNILYSVVRCATALFSSAVVRVRFVKPHFRTKTPKS
jgi:hypothetical protein